MTTEQDKNAESSGNTALALARTIQVNRAV